MLTGSNNKNRHTRAEWLKRVAALVVVGALTAACFAGTVFAVDDTDCSLTVNLTSGFEDDFTDENEKVDTSALIVDLYKVADFTEVEGFDTYTLTVESSWNTVDSTLAAAIEKAQVKAEDNQEQWEAIAQTAVGIVADGKITSITASGTVGTKIEELEAGLYLALTHTDEDDYFFEDEESGDILTVALTDTYEYHFSPQLISLPAKDKDGDGVIDPYFFETSYDWGDWIYDAKIVLKGEREERFGSIKVTKTLDDYDSDYTATFVFDVEAVKTIKGKEQTVYSNVFTLNFNAAGNNSFTVEKIPVGANVTVTEVYGGSSYELVAVDGGPKKIENSKDVVEFSFENKSGDGPGGYGILNTFSSDGTQWTWINDYNRDSSEPVSLDNVMTEPSVE